MIPSHHQNKRKRSWLYSRQILSSLACAGLVFSFTGLVLAEEQEESNSQVSTVEIGQVPQISEDNKDVGQVENLPDTKIQGKESTDGLRRSRAYSTTRKLSAITEGSAAGR